MNRDKKLILKLLRYVRDNANDQAPLDMPDCTDYDSATVRYHIALCIQAGFLREFTPRPVSGAIRIRSLTWQGHDYLEANCDC